MVPTNAAEALTLKSPRSVTLDVQAERLPDSNPLAKIRSVASVALGVDVMVAVGVNVNVGVRDIVPVREGVTV